MAEHNTHPTDPAFTKQSTAFTRQSLFTMSFNPFTQAQKQPVSAPKNGTCTHLTMTRLYTEDFRCVVCYQIASTGWLYRCTQDRELILEDDFEQNSLEKFDSMVKLFPKPNNPRKRSPQARARIDSFLDENSKEQLASYSNEQLMEIYNQRVHVLQIAAEDTEAQNQLAVSHTAFTSFPSSPTSASRPWVPVQGTECQFKCCHHCRPNLAERAHLSLNGIVEGDIPLTAVTGFGFHLRPGKRPVALVENVKNLGLRPSPITPSENPGLQVKHRKRLNPLRVPPLPTGVGLGLISPNTNTNTNASKPLPFRPLPAIPTSSAAENTQIYDFAYGPRSPSAHLPTDTSTYDHGIAETTPLPPQTVEELEKVSGPLTPMEEEELAGYFGREPLEVGGGIAVTEEAVGLHVADLITQF